MGQTSSSKSQRPSPWLGQSGLGTLGPPAGAPLSDREAALGALLASSLQQEAADAVHAAGGPWPRQLQAMAESMGLDLAQEMAQFSTNGGSGRRVPPADQEKEKEYDANRHQLVKAVLLCRHAGFTREQLLAKRHDADWDGPEFVQPERPAVTLTGCPRHRAMPPGCSLVLPLLPSQDALEAEGGAPKLSRGYPRTSTGVAAVHTSMPQRAIAPLVTGVHAAAAGHSPVGPSPFLFPGLEGVEEAVDGIEEKLKRDPHTGLSPVGADDWVSAGLGASRCMMHSAMVRASGPSRPADWVSQAAEREGRAASRAARRVSKEINEEKRQNHAAGGRDGDGEQHESKEDEASRLPGRTAKWLQAKVRAGKNGVVRAQVSAPAPADLLWYCERALGVPSHAVDAGARAMAWLEGMLWAGRLPMQKEVQQKGLGQRQRRQGRGATGGRVGGNMARRASV